MPGKRHAKLNGTGEWVAIRRDPRRPAATRGEARCGMGMMPVACELSPSTGVLLACGCRERSLIVFALSEVDFSANSRTGYG